MSNEPSRALPPHGRLISAGMAGAAALGLLLNHFMAESLGIARLMLLCLGPLALFLGIGGMVEPKIFWSVGKYGKHLPVIYKMIGGALGIVGVACTILLLVFVYRFGPPDRKPSPRLRQPGPTFARSEPSRPSSLPSTPPAPERRATPQEMVLLTYDRPNKRWVQMDEEALQGVRREQTDGVTSLHYAEGEHALLKVVWPDVLEAGDRFTVELQGANSVEMIDLDGADANARASLPASDAFVVVEMRREADKVTFDCGGESQQTFYASGKLRGDAARDALLATALRPGFSLKKGAQASFRNAQIVKP